MAIIIGTDEAGYGPNYGPLVISASVWRVPDDVRAEQLYERLRHCVSPTVAGTLRVPSARSAVADGTVSENIGNGVASHKDRRRDSPPTIGDGACHSRIHAPAAMIAIADSKALYQPATGLKHLERGVLAALGVLGACPTCWQDICERLAPQHAAAWQSEAVHGGFDTPLPIEADAEELAAATACFADGLREAGVELLALVSRPVLPGEFNTLVERHGSKGVMLSRLTLELVKDSLAPFPLAPVEVICDKHGGRNRYAALIAERFDVGLIDVRSESRPKSVYRATEMGRRLDFTFSMQAESYLPVALASMASKYLRELAMLAFNRFWSAQIDGLLPTAGYPADAQRFKAAIAATQSRLGIDDRVLWRVK